ncbi:MAG: DNA-binding transcriptional regulator [Patescibacteria group bacterium]|nr:DNA-binding transcriptional regulator [Patescibacteria group bacterium]
MSAPDSPRVAVLVDTSTGWGRRLIRGVAGYARKHGPWRLWVDDWGQRESLRLPPGWTGEGILCRVADHAIYRHVRQQGVPVVNVSGIELKGVNLPRAATDMQAAARLAAAHFLDRGFRRFAYCGPYRLSYVAPHRDAFLQWLANEGHACEVYRPGRDLGRLAGWPARLDDLARWLCGLPKPVGVFTWGNCAAREVIYVCQRVGLLVPEHVAVLAGDDDELLGAACSPPLSGVMVASEQIGYTAAEMLDQLIRGKPLAEQTVTIGPKSIATRQSTDTLAIEDQELAQAIRFIREHASTAIRIDDIVAAVAISRRHLEASFQEVLGRTPAAEIRRVHLERARELLAETDLPIPSVALKSGFGSPEYLAYVFKEELGVSPRSYRTRIRGH